MLNSMELEQRGSRRFIWQANNSILRDAALITAFGVTATTPRLRAGNLAGTAEAGGNIVGFGVGDAAREVVRGGVIAAAGEEYAPQKSGLRTLGENAGRTAGSFLKTLDKPPEQIAEEQAALFRNDEVLPKTVRMDGKDLPLAEALRNPVFNKAFREALDKQAQAGVLDTKELVPRLEQFNDLETRRLAALEVRRTQDDRLSPSPVLPI
jgi:hypothetical protein